MLAGDFARKLKKLNPRLHISSGNDPKRPACLYYDVDGSGNWESGQFYEICSVDKNELPEFLLLDETNHVVKGGWRRVLNILVQRGLIDRRKAELVFCTGLDKTRFTPKFNKDFDAIQRAISQAKEINMNRRGNERHFNKHDLLDIGQMIRARRGK